MQSRQHFPCSHVSVSEPLRRSKLMRKSSFLDESGLCQVVRDAPFSERRYLPNDNYRFKICFKRKKPGGGLVDVTLEVHIKGHGKCVIYRIHTPGIR